MPEALSPGDPGAERASGGQLRTVSTGKGLRERVDRPYL